MAEDTSGRAHAPLDLLEVVIANAPVVLFATDANGVITLSRGYALHALGLEQDELVGQSALALYPDEPAVADSIRRALEGEAVTSRLHFGSTWHEARLHPLLDADGHVNGVIGVAIDISEQGRLEETIRADALSDRLTGLPNRDWLRDHIEALIEGSRRSFAVVTVGLNRFRDVNSTYGFVYGDEVLRQVGERLRSRVGSGSAVARTGGDEFGVVLSEDELGTSFVSAGERVTEILTAPLLVENEVIEVECSAGVAFHPEHGDSADLLLLRGNVAMRAAKDVGSTVMTYKSQRDEIRINNVKLLAELRDGLLAGHLLFHYQPRVDLTSGEVTGVEALIRWNHPERGLVPPAEFIPLAERSGLLRQLTPWTLHTAARQAASWRASDLAVPIAVNLSARSFMDAQLPRHVEALLERWELPGEALEIELTESAVMVDVERAVDICAGLRALGVRIAIDDFGAGYSPLVYLRELKPYAMKIDSAFIDRMLDHRDDDVIVGYIIGLGRQLGIRVIAEGAENEETLDRLRDLGCHEAQGYHLARPAEAVDIERWIKSRRGDEASELSRSGL